MSSEGLPRGRPISVDVFLAEQLRDGNTWVPVCIAVPGGRVFSYGTTTGCWNVD